MKATVDSIPKLRFSGFKEPWALKPMKQLLRLTERPFKMADDGVYSLVKVRRGNNGVVSRGLYEGRKVLVKSQFKVQTDDFIISKRQIVHQACGIVPVDLDGSIVSNEYDVFRPSPECCIRYFDYFCYRPEMRHAFFLSCVGVHLEKMLFKTEDWLKRRFHFPSVDEQRKIADFLTAVDGRLAQLSQKKALLEAYKKGVMQQLFSQALRFKDDHGNDFPDWEEKTLGDVSSVITSGSRDWAQFYSETGSLFVRMTNLPRKGIYLLLDELKFVSLPKDGHEGARTSLRPQDILISITAELGKIGWIPENLGEAFINQHTALVRPILKLVDSKFIAYGLAHSETNVRLNRLNDAGAKSALNLSTIREFTIQVPSLPEQTKIANFLDAHDRKIETVAAQTAHTQTWKKGLLQQMFV